MYVVDGTSAVAARMANEGAVEVVVILMGGAVLAVRSVNML